MPAPDKTANRTRHGLIALIALRQAKAIRARREREAAGESAKTEARPPKRGWFR